MIHLIYAGNDLMFKGILSSLVSIARKTTRPITAHILTGDFSEIDQRFKPFREDQRAFLDKVVKFYEKNSSVKVLDLSEDVHNEIKTGKNLRNRFSPYTLLRLFIDKDMIGSKRALYLDADILANKDISELFDMDLQGNYIAMVPDAVGSVWLYPNYCNAGMILMDLEAIGNTNIFSLCRKMVFTKKMWMPDQTAINTYFEDRKLYLPRRFNEQKKTHPDTVLRHFCDVMHLWPYLHVVKVKQWDVERVHSVLNEHAFDDVLNNLDALLKAFEKGEAPDGVLFTSYYGTQGN